MGIKTLLRNWLLEPEAEHTPVVPPPVDPPAPPPVEAAPADDLAAKVAEARKRQEDAAKAVQSGRRRLRESIVERHRKDRAAWLTKQAEANGPFS